MSEELDLLTTHHETVDASGNVKISRVTPYLAITTSPGMSFYLKAGKILTAKGRAADSIPEALLVEMQRCSTAALQEAGFKPEDVRNSDTIEELLEAIGQEVS